MKATSIDALNASLMETIEMLKNNRDDRASDNEKIDVETARAIAMLAKTVVEGYKVKAQVLNMMRNADNPRLLSERATSAGVLEIESNKILEDER